MARAKPVYESIPTANRRRLNEMLERARMQTVEAARPLQPGEKRWLSQDAAAEHLGMTKKALLNRARAGLVGIKEGGRWRFSLAELERYATEVERKYRSTH